MVCASYGRRLGAGDVGTTLGKAATMTGTSESVEKTTAEVHTRGQCTYGQQKAICLEHFNFDYGVARLERRRYGDHILLDSETTRSLGSGCRWVIQHCSHAVQSPIGALR